MLVVNDWSSLKWTIERILKQCLEEIALQTAKELQKHVQTEWYEAHSPQFYDRTYQLLNSITNSNIEQKGNKFIVSIYFDHTMITPNFLGNNGFNEHMGFDGIPFVGGLIETIEEGNLSPHSPSYARNGIHMVEKTAYWLSTNLLKISKEVFRKYGINLIIT
jgi:hypothetical protein